MNRISTGNTRLDTVLGGGLIANAITLVVGAPGSGKTILAEQFLFANATPERPGLYLSTASEPFDKLLRYGQSLDFFDAGRVGRSVFYDDLGDALIDNGLAAVLERIDAMLKAHHPGIVIIDSFKALKMFAAERRGLPSLSSRAGRTVHGAGPLGHVGRRIRRQPGDRHPRVRRGGYGHRPGNQAQHGALDASGERPQSPG